MCYYRELIGDVKYSYQTEDAEKTYGRKIKKYLEMRENKIISVYCSYHNNHINATDSLNAIMELYNKDTLLISFDVVNLLLKKTH